MAAIIDRFRRRKLAASMLLGGAALMLLAPVTGAAADEADNVFQRCEAALGDSPGNLQKTLWAGETELADGDTVAPGDVLTAKFTWIVEDWSDLDVFVDCVFVDGSFTESLSYAEKSATEPENDGTAQHDYTVPAGSSEVCDYGRLSGNPTGENESTHKSTEICVTVETGSTTTTTTTTTTVPDGTTTTTVPEGTTTTTVPQTTTTTVPETTTTTVPETTTTTVEEATTTTTTVAPAIDVLPDSTVQTTTTTVPPTVEVLAEAEELAATGADSGDLLLFAGLTLGLGGLLLLFGEKEDRDVS